MRSLLVWLAIGAMAGLLVATGSLPAKAPDVPETWSFSLQGGDPEAGREAFVRMKCGTCHAVPGAGIAVGEGHGSVGPELTADYANLQREYLAESIMNPNRFVAHEGFETAYTAPDGSSRMGDYSHAMTVRELVDIVEFLGQPR